MEKFHLTIVSIRGSRFVTIRTSLGNAESLGFVVRLGYDGYMETEDSHNVAVVVADNQETVLQSISMTLEKAGFTVLAASSSAAAIRFCSESAHPVDLAIIDSATEGINAPELAGQLDRISPGIRTLFLTDDQNESFRVMPRSGHIHGFLRKPFRRAHLLGQVLEIMDRPMVLTA